jgi:hypothetical protein
MPEEKQMIFDDKIDRARVHQFASQIVHVPQNVKARLEEMFNGDRSVEYYEGLLSGYANMYSALQDSSPAKNLAGQLVAFVADHLEKKYQESGR